MQTDYPILEFDPVPTAIINPMPQKIDGEPCEAAVLCFFQDVFQALDKEGKLQQVGILRSEIGDNPVYSLEYEGERLWVAHPGVGAALGVCILEELIASGVRYFVACGGAGVLNPEIAPGLPMVITSAVRDEGVSYHYLPAGYEAVPSQRAITVLESTLKAHGCEYRLVKSWTTDAIYRETEMRRLQRVAEGCDAVEMEAAGFFAAALFRNVEFGQLIYSGDVVTPEGWDPRAWDKRIKDRTDLFWYSVEAAIKLKKTA